MSSTYLNSRTSSESVTSIGWCSTILDVILTINAEIMNEIHNIEQIFIRLHNLYAFMCQICFFILCEQILDSQDLPDLKSDKHLVVALTTILFYSVFGYFATRLKDICQPNRSRNLTGPSFTNYFKWIFKIIFEWAKAIIVVLCLKEQGIQYEPKLVYTFVTFVYYLCTEKIFIEIFPAVVELMNLDSLENLERLYVPLTMNGMTIVAGLGIGVYTLFFISFSKFVILSLYFMVYLRMKDAYYNYYDVLVTEREAYRSFKVATQQEIREWDDICAVCLNNMSRARITPCNHLFHPYCLKQCLKTSYFCPLCKQHFLNTRSRVKD